MGAITINYYRLEKGRHNALYMSIRMPGCSRIRIKFPHVKAETKDWSGAGGRFVTGKGRSRNVQNQWELDRWKNDMHEYINDFYLKHERYPLKGDLEKFLQFGKQSKKMKPTVVKTDLTKGKPIVPEISKLIGEFTCGETLNKGKKMTKSSIDGYVQIRNVLEAYQQAKKKTLTTTSMMEESTIRSIEQYLTQDLQLKINTVGKRMKNLKSIIIILIRRGLMTKNPFFVYAIQIPKEDVFNIALNKEDLEELEQLDLSKNKTLEHVRDHFLCMCFTALRVSDYRKFISYDHSKDVVGVWTTKTKELSCVPISPPLRRILEKYDGKMPRLVSSQKMAKYIKDVCSMIPSLCEPITRVYTQGGQSIEETVPKYTLISNHTARRTFVTVMMRLGVRHATIMKVTGHKDERSLKIYNKMLQEESVKEVVTVLDQHFK
jgi:site-specific recombinase XerD